MSTFPPTAGFINSLDPANPINADFVYGSDDWHRFIQQVVFNQFQTSEDDSANGYDIAVTAKASELNTLDGINTGSTVESRLAALEADAATLPSGTVMSFFQAAAPSGWTQQTTSTYDNAMLRVVNTAGGGSGGSDSPILNDKVASHTHTWSTTGGSHTHSLEYNTGSGNTAFQNAATFAAQDSVGNQYMSSLGASGSRSGLVVSSTHSHSGTTDANSGASNWTPKYVDMIICSKN